jgi:hypothetical protein
MSTKGQESIMAGTGVRLLTLTGEPTPLTTCVNLPHMSALTNP